MDCVEDVNKYLDDGKVNVIVTSPPYTIGLKYNSYDDTISRNKYLDWIEIVGKEYKRVLDD